MGLIVSFQFASVAHRLFRRGMHCCLFVGSLYVTFAAPVFAFAQTSTMQVVPNRESDPQAITSAPAHTFQARHFLSGRTLVGDASAARAMDAARRQQATMLAQQAASAQISGLSATWQAVGPNQVSSIAYGNVTGRVSAIAIDPADTTGNTVYLGTTGGGVWKSTNATGPMASVTFAALTDTLPVFSANAGTASIPSLSIGAISVQSGVILAGTGDPNDASDSFYGGGLLRSADGGLTWTLIQSSQDGATGSTLLSGSGLQVLHGAV